MRKLNSVASVPKLMQEWDKEKNEGISPDRLSLGSNIPVWWRCEKGHSWQINPNHRNRGSECPYCKNKKTLPGFNDLASKFPALLDEWDRDRNEGIDPSFCNYLSNKKVWWICQKKHSWRTAISNRTRLNSQCPYCQGQRTITGENDLLTVNPKLASEWHPDRNGNLSPEQVMPNSGKKVWWLCKQGHSWQAAVYSRKNNGCPYCSGRKAVPGENDLKTLFPELASEWDKEKNGNLRPENVGAWSNLSVWWLCKAGHSWKAKVCDRYNGNNCPRCNDRIKMRTNFMS